jgi:hypothetical protein
MVKGRLGSVKTRKSYSSHNLVTKPPKLVRDAESMDVVYEDDIDDTDIEEPVRLFESRSSIRNEQILRSKRKLNFIIKYRQIKLAIRLISVCNTHRQTQYKNEITSRNQIHTCGYTAPVMAATMLFLDSYNINSERELWQQTFLQGDQCLYIKPHLFTAGINEAVGHLWDLHTPFGTGIAYLNAKQPHLFTTQINQGVNIISFFVGTVSIHHSFIYLMGKTCFLVDSWETGKGVSRKTTPTIVKVSTVLKALTILIKNDNHPLKNKVMQNLFLAPIGKYFSHMHIVPKILKQDHLKQLIVEKFAIGCRSGKTSFGGNYKTQFKRQKEKLAIRKTKKYRQ